MDFINNLDQLIRIQMLLIQRDWATPFMVFITNFLSPITLPIFALLLVGWFWYKKQITKIFLVVLSLGGGYLLEVVLKIFFGRLRPTLGLIAVSDYSFPSGHATLAMVFFSLLVYLFSDKFKNRIIRWIYISANIILILLVGFSRLYLAVHWFSDVIGGYVLGGLWLFLAIKLLDKIPEKTPEKMLPEISKARPKKKALKKKSKKKVLKKKVILKKKSKKLI